ncbi:MAG: high-affinity branched-chain amino acid ABC transporter permease LivM [Desulfobulbus sp.]|jgi:branched-chain amino acid transport system permease protein
MPTRTDLLHALRISLWFMVLTFPLLVIRVDPVEHSVTWRWWSLLWAGLTGWSAALVGRMLSAHLARRRAQAPGTASWLVHLREQLGQPQPVKALLILIALFFLAFPALFSIYQVNIMSTALLYVILGLGLNIVVGFAGLLDLGYAAFYAAGAYTYGLLHLHFGWGFWTVLPIGGLIGTLFGVLLGFPVLRLRGDYLAIVTLGFGEIIRLVLENWTSFTGGPAGIANIPRPGLFGLELSLDGSIIYLYYLLLGMAGCTILVVSRLRDSRIGRAWFALREDEIACQAMGIDRTRIKLAAFALGATWAGMAGVFFAAKTTFINPASFTFLESAIILCIVVLGGMGSIVGVILGAFILILLPEYLRAVADYRMLAFGAVLVAMMVFRPQGLITPARRSPRNPGLLQK